MATNFGGQLLLDLGLLLNLAFALLDLGDMALIITNLLVSRPECFGVLLDFICSFSIYFSSDIGDIVSVDKNVMNILR